MIPHIIIDTREQTPFTFARFECKTIRATLQTGDYSLEGFEDRIAIERKNPDDILACLTSERDRFIRELERLRAMEAAAVVIECLEGALVNGYHRARIAPESIQQSLLSMQINYRLPFVFAMTRERAEAATYNLLRHYLRHAERRFRAIKAMSEDRPAGA